MQMMYLIFLIFITSQCFHNISGQRPQTVQPLAVEGRDCICNSDDNPCKCTFVVEHRLTMIYTEPSTADSSGYTVLLEPRNGQLWTQSLSTDRMLTPDEAAKVVTADGEISRLVIVINGVFPGPRIDVYENQMLEITVVNAFHTDSLTIHFHGLHQFDSPWMDGVAFVTQCPILPGQTFVYRFKASPLGTSFYHAHIGDQRSMGLYGPLIVRRRVEQEQKSGEIIVTLQDWNHLMDAETAYQRMITEQFDLTTGQVIPTTMSVDTANFSRFAFQSGLINGKGRFYKDLNTNNGAPLERFKVQLGEEYRFRIIGAMTLYPMKVYVEDHRVRLRTSDCYNLSPISVQSIIIHPGERYDFNLNISNTGSGQKQFMLIAETIETDGHSGYHAAEAIIEIDDVNGQFDEDPPKGKTTSEICNENNPCTVFNCPYGTAGTTSYQNCLNFNNVSNTEAGRNPSEIKTIDEEYFFNFAFPGPQGNTPGSVNGREFVSPTSPLLTQQNSLRSGCNPTDCQNDVCKCTYIVDLPRGKVIQMIFTNIGSGSGWSHPVHLHGHTFYVMKMGLGTYDRTTGRLVTATTDIECTNNYCMDMTWSNPDWKNGNIPDLHGDPPQKDTIVVPTGGYVVVRIVTRNPGMWFLHCHIDLHNTNGMGMVINSSPGEHPAPPTGFPTCGDFFYDGSSPALGDTSDDENSLGRSVAVDVGGIIMGLVLVMTILA